MFRLADETPNVGTRYALTVRHTATNKSHVEYYDCAEHVREAIAYYLERDHAPQDVIDAIWSVDPDGWQPEGWDWEDWFCRAEFVGAFPWRELLVTDSDGIDCGSLGEFLANAEDNVQVRDIVLDEHTKGIREWMGFFVSAPGEDPDDTTPRYHVDWRGFRQALDAALKEVL